MSTFITQDDYRTYIDPDLLARFTEDDPALLDTCEMVAIEYMRGFLSARYDVAAIFSATDTDRNPLLIMFGVHITLYHLYSRLAPESVPELRAANYEVANRWLTKVQKQEINPPDLPLITTGEKDYVQYGSNPKRTQHLT